MSEAQPQTSPQNYQIRKCPISWIRQLPVHSYRHFREDMMSRNVKINRSRRQKAAAVISRCACVFISFSFLIQVWSDMITMGDLPPDLDTPCWSPLSQPSSKHQRSITIDHIPSSFPFAQYISSPTRLTPSLFPASNIHPTHLVATIPKRRVLHLWLWASHPSPPHTSNSKFQNVQP
jgi:hypothetical protein